MFLNLIFWACSHSEPPQDPGSMSSAIQLSIMWKGTSFCGLKLLPKQFCSWSISSCVTRRNEPLFPDWHFWCLLQCNRALSSPLCQHFLSLKNPHWFSVPMSNSWGGFIVLTTLLCSLSSFNFEVIICKRHAINCKCYYSWASICCFLETSWWGVIWDELRITLSEDLNVIKHACTYTSPCREEREDILGICFPLVRCNDFESGELSTVLYLFLSRVRASFSKSKAEEKLNSEEKIFFFQRLQNETILHLSNLIKNCMDILFLSMAAVSTLNFNERAERKPLGKGFPLPPPSLASQCKRLYYSIMLCAYVEWVNACGWTVRRKSYIKFSAS